MSWRTRLLEGGAILAMGAAASSVAFWCSGRAERDQELAFWAVLALSTGLLAVGFSAGAMLANAWIGEVHARRAALHVPDEEPFELRTLH